MSNTPRRTMLKKQHQRQGLNRLHKALSALALLSLSAALPSFAAAATADPQEAQLSENLDAMVVTASRTAERAIDVPVSTQVISAEQIKLSGAVDLGDVIAKFVTGHVHKYPGLLNPVGLRGFRSDTHGSDLAGYVLILIDGHRVGTGNAAKINMDRIDHIEVIKGPSSALYGSAAMGGVINLITKKGEGELGGDLSAEYGSFDSYKGEVSLGGEVSEKFSLFSSFSQEHSGDYDDPSYGTVYNSGYDKTNFGANLNYRINNDHELRLGGNFSAITSESPDWLHGTYTTYDATASQDNDKSTGYADLEYNGDFFGGRLHWKGTVYYLWDKNHWNWGSPDPASDQTEYIDRTLGTDHQFNWKMTDWNSLLVGFTLESMEKESSAISSYLPSMPYTPGLDYDNQALFAQDSIDLFDNRLNIILAARYDRFDVSATRGETGDYTEFTERNESYDHISPKAGIGLKMFDEKLRVRANMGQGFKSPTADQLAADYVHSSTGVHYLGNPDLDPETSLTSGLGVDLYLPAFTVSLDYFHTDYEDKIVSSTSKVNGVKTTTYINSGDALLEGIDLNLEWHFADTLALPCNASLYSNMTFNFTKDDKASNKDLLYVSDYEVKAGLNMAYEKLSGQLSYVLVGPQMITNYDSYLTEEKDSFDFWDLTLRYQLSDQWELRGSILNLFDQDVEWVRGNLMAERAFKVGLTYHFSI